MNGTASFTGRSVLITGACGTIVAELTRQVSRRGHRACGMHR